MSRLLGRNPTRRCMPVEEWPSQDHRGWETAPRSSDVLDPAGERSIQRQGSSKAVVAGYGRWLTYLRSQSQLDPNEPPADRITRERVGAYMAELWS